MTKLPIIIAPDPRLLQISEPIKEITQEIKIFLDKMLLTMYESNGIGLAAPQVGVLSRLIVMDCSDKNNKKKSFKFINPEILEFSNDMAEFEEGCLSLPTQFAKVDRPESIFVNYKDETGKNIQKRFYGIEATCLQHEIDHLNGKLFVDHISKLKKNRILNKLQKYKKKIISNK